MALIRVLLCCVVLYDVLAIGYHGLIHLLWAPKELGGAHDIVGRLEKLTSAPEADGMLSTALTLVQGPWVYQVLEQANLLSLACISPLY